MRKDHKVSFKSIETIDDIASMIRNSFRIPTFHGFDVISYLLSLKTRNVPSKGHLLINFFEMQVGGVPAKVTFNPLTLHVDQEIWAEAKLGEPGARRILAHELGHIILHDHYALPFSGEKGVWLREEESAEWQADRFADCILLSIEDLTLCEPASKIAIHFGVEIDVVNRRLKYQFKNVSIFCSWCSNMAFAMGGKYFKCNSCGSSGCI